MSIRTDNNVTLSHADAEAIACMLEEHSRHLFDAARKTKQAAVARECRRWAEEAKEQARRITEALYTWQ